MQVDTEFDRQKRNSHKRTEDATCVSACLNYLGPMEAKPTFHIFDRKQDNLNLVGHSVVVTNARGVRRPASLDTQGFCLRQHTSTVTNLGSRRAVLEVYRGEIQQLLKVLTRASLVIAQPLGVVRNNEQSHYPARPTHAPVRFVHSDYTDNSGREQIRRFVGPEAASVMHQRRCVIYSVWRSITPPPQDAPLALCDLRTVAPQDYVTADTILDFPGSRLGTIETSLVRFSARHEWYYFHDMTPNEVLIFKAYDSDIRGANRVPHTAFDYPVGRPVEPRASLDIRALAIF